MDCCKQDCSPCPTEDSREDVGCCKELPFDEEMCESVTIGKKVPNCLFDVYHNEDIKKDVSLKDYNGKWLVLFFYPADFTFVCPTELEELATYYQEFQSLGVEVISVSTDTVFTHKAWHDISPAIKKITYPMAADPTGTLSKTFGTYIPQEGLSLRGTFLIDPSGVLKVIEIHDNSIGRNAKELLRKIKAAQFVEKNPGNVCPASWEPGKDSLKPGLDLVGKI